MIRSIVLTIFSLGIAFVVSANGQFAHAQTDACDPDFETVMEARATLEAMREVEIAQTLILKPDSVLEYSCFNTRISELNAADNSMFTGNVSSGSSLFNNPVDEFTPSGPYAGVLPTITTGSVSEANYNGGGGLVFGPNPPGAVNYHSDLLGNMLGVLITDSLFEFVYLNFGHTFGGGTFSGLTGGVCAPMQNVWNFSKCTNVSGGWFRTFEEFALGDFRTKPLACDDATRNNFWADMGAASPSPGDPGGVDVVVTYSDVMSSSACSGVVPVPTGVQVFAKGASPDFEVQDVGSDFVCMAPGCYYNRASGNCEN